MHKFFLIIFSLILLFNISTTDVYALSFPFNGDNFTNASSNTEEARNYTDGIIKDIDEGLGNGLVEVLEFLYKMGDVIAVCVLISFGIRYVVATPQKKADLKASMYPYFVGLLLYIVGVPIAVSIINIFIKVF